MWRGRILMLLFLFFGLSGCQSLPYNGERQITTKLSDVTDTQLYQGVESLLGQRDAQVSGFYPLASGVNAFVARLKVVETAEKSIDLQYYIWHRDKTGKILAASLLDAADRGVRVRLLLDDMGSPLGDKSLLMLDRHPNVDVRLYNPVSSRGRSMWSMLAEFSRINRRMHNKSLTVDNSIGIVGGRNIGNEYFEAHQDVAFADLDLAVIGPVVDQVSDGFDLYWNHDSSYPISRLTSTALTDSELKEARQQVHQFLKEIRGDEYVSRLLNSDLVNKGVEEWYWGQADVLYDHPDKSHESGTDTSRYLHTQLSSVFSEVGSSLVLVSPYFVPGDTGVEYLSALAERGVEISIITNSLAATDVGAVHSGYAKYRKALLKAGVSLYEVRPYTEKIPNAENKDKNGREKNRRYIGSSSKASLHAKAFFIDGKYTFVGSMNLDPRSIHINTEIGIMLDAAEFTTWAREQILASLQNIAYKVSLDQDGDLRWTSYNESGVEQVFDSEPKVSTWRRFGVWLMGLFPIESQL